MKAMVFAAGYSRRLRPATEKLPKALLRVGGRPMIEYPLLLLRHYGVREIIINLYHLGEQIEAHLEDGAKLGLEISYSREKELLDTGGGLWKARHFFTDERFIVMNGDVMIDLNLEELLAHHRRLGATATLVLREDPKADDYGAIQASADLRIQTFLRHTAPACRDAGPLRKFMFTGVQICEAKIFDFMGAPGGDDPVAFSTTQNTYPAMLLRGEPLYAYPFDGYWQDLGTLERLAETEAKLKRGDLKLHYL